MKNTLIKEFRERYKTLSEERELIKNYIDKTQPTIDSYYKKYFEIERIKQHLHYFISRDELNEIQPKDIFYFSSNGEKIYPLKSGKRIKEDLNRILLEIDNQMDYFEEMTVKYCKLIQSHIDKLELVEDTYYKLLYTIDYLELGADSIGVNNKFGYGHFLKMHYNTFSGYQTSMHKLKNVKFKEEDILMFLKETEQQPT